MFYYRFLVFIVRIFFFLDMEEHLQVIVELKIIVKRLECGGLKILRHEYQETQGSNLIQRCATRIRKSADIMSVLHYFTNNISTHNKLFNVVKSLYYVQELMNSFHDSSGKRHYTNFNYIRSFRVVATRLHIMS